MRKIITTLFLLCTFFAGLSQTTNDKNENLQLLLDGYQEETGNGADVSIRKINENLKLFDQQKQENDSLRLLVSLLKTDLLLAQQKVASYTSLKESMAVTHVSKSNYRQIVEASLNSLSTETITLKKGSYVIIDSERTKEKVRKKLVAFRKQFSEYELIVIQNKRQTWFHVCLSERFAQDIVGTKVALMRNKGISDTWSITLE